MEISISIQRERKYAMHKAVVRFKDGDRERTDTLSLSPEYIEDVREDPGLTARLAALAFTGRVFDGGGK